MADIPDVASQAPPPAAAGSVPDVAAASQTPTAPTEPAGAPQVAAAPETAPVPDAFDQAIAGADASEASVDDLFTDLG